MPGGSSRRLVAGAGDDAVATDRSSIKIAATAGPLRKHQMALMLADAAIVIWCRATFTTSSSHLQCTKQLMYHRGDTARRRPSASVGQPGDLRFVERNRL